MIDLLARPASTAPASHSRGLIRQDIQNGHGPPLSTRVVECGCGWPSCPSRLSRSVPWGARGAHSMANDPGAARNTLAISRPRPCMLIEWALDEAILPVA
jgi:hypothetical protein